MTNLLPLLFFQDNTATSAPSAAANAFAAGALVLWAVVLLFFIAVGWKIFTKAGQPGWAILVPIYNIIVLLKIVGKPAWWFLLMLIPIVNFVVLIMVDIELAKRFGKGMGFALGLIFLGIIFAPILAFGSAKYQPA
jgi:hypothetical protein